MNLHGSTTFESRDRLDELFCEMKREDPVARRQRWQGHYDHLASASGQVILFGAGQFGRFILDGLRSIGQLPIYFSDNNPIRWGTQVDGIEVLSPNEAFTRFGSTATFVVSIFNGSAARRQLRAAGVKNVVPALTLAWKYPQQFIPGLGIDVPESLLAAESQIQACFGSLSDDSSRQEFCDQIQWRYWYNPESLPFSQPVDEMYFPSDLVRPDPEEVLVDCGAFDGDTIRSFVKRGQDFKHIYALEPDPRNRTALEQFLAQQPSGLRSSITVLPYGIGDTDETVVFAASGDVTSKVISSGDGIRLDCKRLDTLSWPLKPTYIKMDIEGFEPKALAGGAKLLGEEAPVLAICLYHCSEHLWQIPNLIHSLQPDYKLYLRRYAEDCWENICYAVPTHRLRDGVRRLGLQAS